MTLKLKMERRCFTRMLYLAIDQDNEGCDYLKKAVQAGFSGDGSLVVYNRFCINSP